MFLTIYLSIKLTLYYPREHSLYNTLYVLYVGTLKLHAINHHYSCSRYKCVLLFKALIILLEHHRYRHVMMYIVYNSVKTNTY